MPAQMTPYDLCSRALVKVGATAITSFDDNTAESIAAGQEYELAVETALSGHRWNFARATETLSPMAEEPEAKFDKFYELSGACLIVRAVYAQDGRTPIHYERHQNRIACDEPEQIVVDYDFRAAESLWPPYFREYMTLKLAESFALTIARQPAMSETLAKAAERQWRLAKLADSQQQPPKQLRRGRLTAGRN